MVKNVLSAMPKGSSKGTGKDRAHEELKTLLYGVKIHNTHIKIVNKPVQW